MYDTVFSFLYSVGFVAGRIIFAMMGKFSVMNSFDAIFVFSAELFPTVVRYVSLFFTNQTRVILSKALSC